MSSNYENFELLVKFDSDDKGVRKVLPKLDTYPFKVKYLIEPRGRGYVDLHVFFNRLFPMIDDRSVVLGNMGDDFEIIQEGWDEIVLSKTNIFPDQIYIIHDYREAYEEQRFYQDFDINTIGGPIIFDEASLWSRKLLEICNGFGHVSFTDAWTVMLEYYLFHRCGINRTIFLEKPLVKRRSKAQVDGQSALRWWTERASNFDFIRSPFYKTLVEQQAVNLYLNIEMAEKLPPPLVLKESSFVPEEFPAMVLRIRALNLFPSFMRPGLIKLWLTFKPYLRKMNLGFFNRFIDS